MLTVTSAMHDGTHRSHRSTDGMLQQKVWQTGMDNVVNKNKNAVYAFNELVSIYEIADNLSDNILTEVINKICKVWWVQLYALGMWQSQLKSASIGCGFYRCMIKVQPNTRVNLNFFKNVLLIF